MAGIMRGNWYNTSEGIALGCLGQVTSATFGHLCFFVLQSLIVVKLPEVSPLPRYCKKGRNTSLEIRCSYVAQYTDWDEAVKRVAIHYLMMYDCASEYID